MPWKKEQLSGTLDGINKDFTVTETPLVESLMIFFPANYCESAVIGQPQERQYRISGTTITFAVAPSGQRPWARYFYYEA